MLDSLIRALCGYMKISPETMVAMAKNVEAVIKSVDARLAAIDERTARIEAAMGIKPPVEKPDDKVVSIADRSKQ